MVPIVSWYSVSPPPGGLVYMWREPASSLPWFGVRSTPGHPAAPKHDSLKQHAAASLQATVHKSIRQLTKGRLHVSVCTDASACAIMCVRRVGQLWRAPVDLIFNYMMEHLWGETDGAVKPLHALKVRAMVNLAFIMRWPRGGGQRGQCSTEGGGSGMVQMWLKDEDNAERQRRHFAMLNLLCGVGGKTFEKANI